MEKQHNQMESIDTTPQASKPTYIVGIGASAGGLEAIELFFNHMPVTSGLAFVIIQHLSPDFKSLMDELLSRHTSMPIHYAEEGMEVLADAIYLIPPKKEMIIKDGKLRLHDKDLSKNLSLPIDVFFSSLAKDKQSHAVGIILSGTGSDGSRGIREIKNANGLVMVQSEESSAFDGMPRSAISTGMAKYILPPNELPNALLKHIQHPLAQPADHDQIDRPAIEEGMERIFGFLRDAYGIDFSNYKPSTVTRRIERQMTIHHYESLDEYAENLKSNNENLELLYKDLLIGVTMFFRDPDAFLFIEKKIIPELMSRKKRGEYLRIWVPACATGEEVYSLAILFHEYADKNNVNCNVKIFATDVHEGSLDIAGHGVYTADTLANVSATRMNRYFKYEDGKYSVAKEIRRLVVFAKHNLLKDPPFTKIDFISCRNLLIYFNVPAQKRVISIFHFTLNKDGILFLGPSESLNSLKNEFDVQNSHWKIYNKVRDVRLPDQFRFSLPSAYRTPENRITNNFTTKKRTPGEDTNYSIAYTALLERYVPPSLLVDKHYMLLHTYGDANRFLRTPKGPASLNILDYVKGDVRVALSTALKRAFLSKKPVIYKGIRVPSGDKYENIKLIIEPLTIPNTEHYYALISFETINMTPAVSETGDAFNAGKESQNRLNDLEKELHHTRENLQSTVEELETSNEELQATNEELLASNEELQSTNEELHSVNEELFTVNAEYEKKIEELSQLTNDMDNLLNSTDIGTIFLDEKLNIRKFTPAIADIFNLLPQDLGRPISHISNTINNESFQEKLNEVLNSGNKIEAEVQDTNNRWLLMRILPYKTECDIVDGVVLTFVDITGLRQTEEELRQANEMLQKQKEELSTRTTKLEELNQALKESENQLRHAVLYAPYPIMIHAEDGEVRLLSQAWTDLTGYTQEDIETINDWAEKAFDIEEQEKVKSKIKGLFDFYEQAHEGEYIINTKEGKTRIWEFNSAPLGKLSDNRRLLISMAIDVTQHKKNEKLIMERAEQLEDANETLRYQNKELDQFAYVASHDLQEPLRTIVSFSDLLKEDIGEVTGEVKKDLDHITQAALRMQRLIDDLLAYSRTSRSELKRIPIDLQDLVKNLLQSFKLRIDESGAEIKIDALPKVYGDETLLTLVYSNLLSNALKFIRTEKPLVHFTYDQSEKNIILGVKDNGIGIPAQFKDKIFEPFRRLNHRYKFEGSGIGLAICKMVIEKHGGSIWVVSQTNGGSHFQFSLPVERQVQ